MDNTKTQIEQTTISKHNYYKEILLWCEIFLMNKSGWIFENDLLRACYESENEHIPKEPRVWGAVINTLKSKGVITFHHTQMIKPTFANKRNQSFWVVN